MTIALSNQSTRYAFLPLSVNGEGAGGRGSLLKTPPLTPPRLRGGADGNSNSLRRAKPIGTFLFLFLTFIFPAIGFAQIAQPVEDPQIEQRMKGLTQQIRCLVCQNETLAESQAELAQDLRREIREQMKAGKSDDEILAFLTQRYGDFVLYNPPVKATTYLLWFGPFVLLIAGTVVLYRYVKKRRTLIEEKPLTAEEHQRAERLLRNET
jgi:cytochrome c-type biogenesis protein CcmH